MPHVATKVPKANSALNKDELHFANIGAQISFKKSYQALLQEAQEQGVTFTEKQTAALIRVGRRQEKLGLPVSESSSKAC